MSFNRRRNIYTLGDFQTQQTHKPQQQNRRQNYDLFERDPFKIQSYNFRYAERPQFPIQQLANRVSSKTTVKPFDTYYYNYDFATNQRHKESSATIAFHEYRRRKFLQDQPITTANLFSTQTLPSRQLGSVVENNTGSSASVDLHQQHQQQRQQKRHRLHSYGPAIPSHIQQHRNALECLSATGGRHNNNNVSNSCMRSNASSLYHCQDNSRTCEYLPALRAVSPNCRTAMQQHTHDEQQQWETKHHQHNTFHNSSSSCLFGGHAGSISGRRLCSENSQCGNSRDIVKDNGNGHRTGVDVCSSVDGFTVTVADKNNCEHEYEHALPPVGHAKHNRIPLQTLHVTSSKNVVRGGSGGGGAVEQKQSTCSGCQININIKGLDENELGENVTIKIEATDGSSSKNAACNIGMPTKILDSNLREHVFCYGKAAGFNITSSKSSDTIVIDKHISKFSLNKRSKDEDRFGAREREHQMQRQRERSRSCGQRDYASHRYVEAIDSEAVRMPPSRRLSKERMPSIVPWRLDYNPRISVAKENASIANQAQLYHSQRRRVPPQTPAIDLRKLKSSTPPYDIAATSPRHKFPERKLLNMANSLQRKLDELPIVKRTPSYNSLQSNNNDKKNNRLQRSLTPCSSRELKLRLPGTTPMVYQNHQSHQSLNKLPLNVNINVFADKLNLLRV